MRNSRNINTRRSLVAASAANSVVSGTGISNIASGVTGTVTVTAKDSLGNTITTGGEIFMIKISNICSKANSHYCAPSGATTPLASNINDIMADNGDGTYSYSYILSFIGSVSVQVSLLNQGKVYHKYYSGVSFSGVSTSNCLVNGLNFQQSNITNYCGLTQNSISAMIITVIRIPYTGTINVSVNYDDGFGLWIDDISQFAYICGSTDVTSSFTMNFVNIKIVLVKPHFV